MATKLKQYVTPEGLVPYERWFSKLGPIAAAKVTTALTRLKNGNVSSVDPVGAGVFEYKIDFGPGYRIYFAYDGEKLVILLGGGSKKRQQKDIEEAKSNWTLYKKRKNLL